MLMRALKRFKQAAKIITYDEKHNVTDGEAIERKPLSFYVKKGVSTKVKSDVTSHQQSEDQVVASCTKWLKANGWICKTMFTGGIPIGRGRYATNPAKGIPDCVAFNPIQKRTVWIEYKKTHGGVVSPEQKDWHNLLWLCDQEIYVVTSLDSLKSQVCEKEYMKAG